MYTQEEIDEEAKAASRKIVPWMLLFGALIILSYYLLTDMEYSSYNPYKDHTFYYFQCGTLFVATILTCAFPGIAANNRRKKLEEENRLEEQQKREEHYEKMEKMMEQMLEQQQKTEEKQEQ